MRARAYVAIAYISSLSRTTFSWALLINGLSVALYIWIFTQLYAATYTAVQARIIGGMTLCSTIWVLMFVQCFERATWPNPIYKIDEEIKTGSISYALQRPYNYILYHLFSFYGRVLPTLLGNLVCGTLAAFVLVGPFPLTICGFFGAALAVLLGYTLDFFLFFMLGLMGFWVEDVKPFSWLYSKSKLIFGGVLLPIAFFPASLQKFILLLPFSNLYYTASLIIVQFDIWLLLRCLSVQLVWIVILGCCARALFKRGVRHVTISGG
jgi:ABC-2 type transport system permease protein